jgi:hypothetical protein
VEHAGERGFGSRLITQTIAPHGEMQVEFKSTGLLCRMLIDLDRAVTPRAPHRSSLLALRGIVAA